jgi:hypothetical protein
MHPVVAVKTVTDSRRAIKHTADTNVSEIHPPPHSAPSRKSGFIQSPSHGEITFRDAHGPWASNCIRNNDDDNTRALAPKSIIEKTSEIASRVLRSRLLRNSCQPRCPS